jgi:hypothetical protein
MQGLEVANPTIPCAAGCRCSLLAKIKQQRALSGWFLKSGWGQSFLEIEGEKEAHSTRIPRRRLRFTGK